jgi:DNA-binding YbaB/EbfC family protein
MAANNMMKMMQQAATMRKQMKRMQKELAKHTAEITSNNGKVTVVAAGDMTIKEIRLADDAFDGDKERLEQTIAKTVNSAMSAVKKSSAGTMAKMSGGLGGLSEMLGG